MNLIIENKVISNDIYSILKKVKSQIHNGKLKDIKDRGENLVISCPFHKNGLETHPSCNVYIDKNGSIPVGTYHCFTCGANGSLPKLINECFDESGEFGANWLLDNFTDAFIDNISIDQPISDIKEKSEFLDPSILDEYKYFHPYMFKRKLSEDIIRKFSVGYDAKTDSIVFPVWDEKDNLLFLTRRSVKSKFFQIDKNSDKPVYLLNFIKKENIQEVMVCESQINTLYCWTMGYPAIGLFGTGDDYQYNILRKSNINHYILCLDGDFAGNIGTSKLIKNLPQDCIIDVKKIPRGKDVNDLSKEEFDNLPLLNCYDWLKLYENNCI